MQIKSNIQSFNYIEEISKQLMQDDTILLPSNISNNVIGLEASIIQLLITWKRTHAQPKIKTYIKLEDKSKKLKIYSKLYALIAFYLVDDIYFYGKESKEINRKEILNRYSNMINKMNQPYKSNANYINAKIVCIKGAKLEYIKTLFDTPGRTKSNLITRTSFEKLTKKIISTNKNLSGKINRQGQHIANISHILYEAFLNTIEHGYTNIDNVDYDRNVRGIIFKEHRYYSLNTLNNLIESDEKNGAFKQYLLYCEEIFKKEHGDNQQEHEQRVERIPGLEKGKPTESYSFLELSVFDGGCGIAHRLSSKGNLSLEEERGYCVKAFKKRVGSKNTSGFGIGLSDVWNTLIDLKAFIRLRTGRISLYQVFHGDVKKDEPSFQDWSSENDLQKMEGSVLTILIPIFNRAPK